jgi:hypothetical protein
VLPGLHHPTKEQVAGERPDVSPEQEPRPFSRYAAGGVSPLGLFEPGRLERLSLLARPILPRRATAELAVGGRTAGASALFPSGGERGAGGGEGPADPSVSARVEPPACAASDPR